MVYKQILIAYPGMTRKNSLRNYLNKYPNRKDIFVKVYKDVTVNMFKGFRKNQWVFINVPEKIRNEIWDRLKEIQRSSNPYLKVTMNSYSLEKKGEQKK